MLLEEGISVIPFFDSWRTFNEGQNCTKDGKEDKAFLWRNRLFNDANEPVDKPEKSPICWIALYWRSKALSWERNVMFGRDVIEFPSRKSFSRLMRTSMPSTRDILFQLHWRIRREVRSKTNDGISVKEFLSRLRKRNETSSFNSKGRVSISKPFLDRSTNEWNETTNLVLLTVRDCSLKKESNEYNSLEGISPSNEDNYKRDRMKRVGCFSHRAFPIWRVFQIREEIQRFHSHLIEDIWLTSNSIHLPQIRSVP